VVDVHRYHEISESTHRIMNPLAPEQVVLLGEICGLGHDQRQLDLASGKGEMLCQLASRHGIAGVGIDVFFPYTTVATARADELGVSHLLEFLEGDAATYASEPASFDVVSCIGASWIGGGLAGTLDLMVRAVRGGGWLLMGKPYVQNDPSPAVHEQLCEGGDFVDLAGTLVRFEDAGLDLVEMVLATEETWDRYAASQWLNVAQWLDEHAHDPDAADVRAIRDHLRRSYLAHGRHHLGWGVFVLRCR